MAIIMRQEGPEREAQFQQICWILQKIFRHHKKTADPSQPPFNSMQLLLNEFGCFQAGDAAGVYGKAHSVAWQGKVVAVSIDGVSI